MAEPDYNEFDDVDRTHDPYISSKKAHATMLELMREHKLGFLINPGGGQFIGDNFNCQISTYDDIDDLAKLRTAIAAKKGDQSK